MSQAQDCRLFTCIRALPYPWALWKKTKPSLWGLMQAGTLRQRAGLTTPYVIQPKRDSFSNKVVNLYSKLLGWVWVRLKFKSQITSWSIPELHDIMQFLHVTSIMIHAFLMCASMNIDLVPVLCFFGIYVMGLDGHCIHRYIIIHCQMISSAFSQIWGQWWGKLSSNVGRN